MRQALFLISFLAVAAATSMAHAKDALKPYEDRLFALPQALEGSWEDGRVVVDYQEDRDVNGRDMIPAERVSMRYVTLNVRRKQKNVTYDTSAGPVETISVGTQKKAEIITIYLHGQGGNHKQGANDFSFGGNFNRLKNLMARNDGLYISTDFANFDDRGAAEIMALMDNLRQQNPSAKIILACGSAGGLVCWKVAESEKGADLAGIALLGSFPNARFIGSPAYQAKVPLYIGHGSRDTVSPIEGMEAFYQSLTARNYDVKLVRFESGIHGTPIRMTDWRQVINWMLE